MKKSRLKARSPKYRAANDAAADARAAYLREQYTCAICYYRFHTYSHFSVPRMAVEIHHMAGRDAKRCDVFERPENWLALCRQCHQEQTDRPTTMADEAWAAKKMTDPKHASLAVLKQLNKRRFRNV